MDFDYFDVSISIYLWCHLLMLVVGTISLTLADGAKQAGLVGCSDIYLSKLQPSSYLFQSREFVCANIYIYI